MRMVRSEILRIGPVIFGSNVLIKVSDFIKFPMHNDTERGMWNCLIKQF